MGNKSSSSSSSGSVASSTHAGKSNQTEKTESTTRAKSNTWIWVFIFFLFAFLVGTIVIVVIAVQQSSNTLPDDIDAVILEDGVYNFSTYQISAIQKFMPFISTIYVLNTANNSTKAAGLIYVPITLSSSPKNDIAAAIGALPGAKTVIYFGNITMPLSYVKKNYLFYVDRPRIFNALRDTEEMTAFGSLYNQVSSFFASTIPDPRWCEELLF